MNRKQALAELIAKVEAGTLIPDNLIVSSEVSAMIDLAVNVSDLHGDVWADLCAAYEGSLDAAKALHEAVLCHIDPQFGYLVGPQYARIVHPSRTVCDAQSKIPARAWLLGILRALHAMDADT